MADEQQLAILRQGGKAWSVWREEHLSSSIDLREADLRNADLNWADLSGANLRGADLDSVNLFGANLRGADLRGAILGEANLGEGNLGKADFSGTDLHGANLREANLIRADFRRADLRGADLGGANLGWANLREVNLGRANLHKATIYETAFVDLDLSSCNGLESCSHHGASIIDHRTLQRSGPLPINFLRGVGLPEALIDYLPSLLGQALEFYSCFISYSHQDKSFARRLHDALQGRGIRCWLDEHQLRPGDDILDEVDRGIKLWDKVLLCCSEASLKGSPWVDREIDKALAKEERLWRERGGKVLALIPLDLDGHLFQWDSGKASILCARLAADFTGWETDNTKFEAAFERVVGALRTDREPPPVSRL